MLEWHGLHRALPVSTGSSLPESASALSPVVQLNADVGTLFLEQGILKVAVDGFYDDDKLSVKIALHL
jgi:hypothetical protein